MLIISSHIPKQHMHKKANMLLLVIPPQSSFLHSHQIQNRNLKRQNKHHHKKKPARMINERLKDKTETVKND